MSAFDQVKQGPPIEVFFVNKGYLDDDHPKKVNLSVGAFRTDDGKPWVLPVVREMEKKIAGDESLNHEYLPVLGSEAFTKAATNMLLGKSNSAITWGKAFGIQALSGTGALRIGATFLATQLKRKIVYITDPTWENHALLLQHVGFEEIRSYKYWKSEDRSLDFDGFCQDLKNAPENSVFVLHACAHNPTGCDPNREQWMEIAKIMKMRNLFPFFDCAYQGFASGNLAEDAWAVRYFCDYGLELFCAQSFAKNFGLYNERVGNLTIVLNSALAITPVKSQMTLIVRGMYSNPPCHGSRIVTGVLTNPVLYAEWEESIKFMSQRIRGMREQLRNLLETKGTPGTWKHITDQIGMFSYTGLTEGQVMHLRENYHIYMMRSGRISIAGLNSSNVDYVAEAIHHTVKEVK